MQRKSRLVNGGRHARLTNHLRIARSIFPSQSLLKLFSALNRTFPSSPGSLYQNEVKCSAFDMEIIFHSHANKTHFHEKGCALGLILKVRVFGTRKWPIGISVNFH